MFHRLIVSQELYLKSMFARSVVLGTPDRLLKPLELKITPAVHCRQEKRTARVLRKVAARRGLPKTVFGLLYHFEIRAEGPEYKMFCVDGRTEVYSSFLACPKNAQARTRRAVPFMAVVAVPTEIVSMKFPENGKSTGKNSNSRPLATALPNVTAHTHKGFHQHRRCPRKPDPGAPEKGFPHQLGSPALTLWTESTPH